MVGVGEPDGDRDDTGNTPASTDAATDAPAVATTGDADDEAASEGAKEAATDAPAVATTGDADDEAASERPKEAAKEAARKAKKEKETARAKVFKPNSALPRSPGKMAPVFATTSTSTADKRKGSPLERTRSSSMADLPMADLPAASDKRVKVGNVHMTRLLAEIKRLNDLIRPTKTKNDIRDSALKVRSLFDIAHADWCQQHESQVVSRNSTGTNAELSDGWTQTPPSIPKQCEADFILRSKGDPSKYDEILKLHWPNEVFESTHFVKGGLFETRPGTARAVICSTGKVTSNEPLSRLALSLPSLKKLNDENLPDGKLAVVRCGEEIEIDGERSSDGPQFIVVAAMETPVAQPALLDIMSKIGAQAAKSESVAIIVSLPSECDKSLARKALELSLFGTGMKGEILVDKHHRQAQQGNGLHQRGGGDRTSFTMIPKEGATLAEIVKRVQEDVDPTSMGITVHSLQETKSGGVQVTF